MQIQTFSEKLCRYLSSLASGFEGHWWWTYPYLNAPHAEVVCYEDLNISVKICPAWQVEDVLRDLHGVLYCIVSPEERFKVVEKITKILFSHPADTAYQKIEEYLWTILK